MILPISILLKEVKSSLTFVYFPQNEAKQFREASEHPTEISDIPLELLLDIFDHLDVYSLTSAAIANPFNRHATEKIFRTKFATDFGINLQKINENQFKRVSNNISEFDAILNAVEVFGHLIKNMTVNYNAFTRVESERINSYLSRYVSESLNEIDLNGCHDRKLGGLIGPFKNVKIVHLRHGEVKASSINFKEIFSHVQTFDLTLMMSLSPESIDHHFPHLKSMNVEYLVASEKFERRLQLNRQLRNLSVYNVNWRGLRMLSELLPKLESLKLLRFYGKSHFEGNHIHFEHMKTFEMKVIQHFPDTMQTVPLVFGYLEEIKFDGSCDKWFEIIVHNEHLKKIDGVGEFSDEQLQQIVKDLTNLEELSMRLNAKTIDSIEKVMGFIGRSMKLKKVTFLKMNPDILNGIRGDKFRNWTFKKEDDRIVLARN